MKFIFTLRQLTPYLILLAVLGFCFCFHISIGAKSVPVKEVAIALWDFDDTLFNHIIVWEMRMPRAVVAVLVGASLSVAGALMQGVTRNPLASPSILGVMHGAALAIVFSVSHWGISNQLFPVVATLGGIVAALLVWSVARLAHGTPLALILSGSAVTALIGSFISILLILDEDTFKNIRVWLTGSLSGSDISFVMWYLPWIVMGITIAIVISRQITSLAMGDDTALGLGVNVARVKALALFAVVLLSSASVSLVGPIGFVGLVVPHVVRLLYGYDYVKIIPYSALLGAIYLLLVDVIARTVISPLEISTGLVTSILGAPLFIWLVRQKL